MLVRKVDAMISKPNSVSQKSMAKKANFPASTISRTIHQNLGAKKLYGEEMPKVMVHMDSASSHTATKTQRWLRDHNIKFFYERGMAGQQP